MTYRIKFHHPIKNWWVFWINAYGCIVCDIDKNRLVKQFKATQGYKDNKLKFKVVEVLK